MNETGQQLEMDKDVQSVLEFMQNTISTERLIGVADHIPSLARILWSRYRAEGVVALSLNAPSLNAPAEKPVVASELAH
jgi:hypothetical protein